MRWDIFCKVIDNHGDLGVCWRLSRDLAARGHSVRLWVDDAAALCWMAPQAAPEGQGHPGITVLAWPADDAPPPQGWPEPGDVVIEAFGCELPGGFLACMQRPAPPRWVNLEYLSAESYVERSHGLRSPVFSGPGAGLLKHFFYPGFTERTGGLLREPGLAGLRDAVQDSTAARAHALEALGVLWQPGERVVSLFCYPGAPVQPLLRQLNQLSQASGAITHVLLTPGTATQQAQDWPTALQGLRLHPLPYLPQPAYDTLLWACDLNMVRGEDSAVRALWAGRPHVWHIYPQDDGVHEGKLQAFMDRWMAAWPPALAANVQALWRAWNGLTTPTGAGLTALDTLWQPPAWSLWQDVSRQSGNELARQPDLVTQLLQFVTAPG